MRQPGVEPGSTAWKATMLTATPLTLTEWTFQVTWRRYKKYVASKYFQLNVYKMEMCKFDHWRSLNEQFKLTEWTVQVTLQIVCSK